MKEIFINIEKINKWLETQSLKLTDLKNSELMTLSVELMNKSLYLLRVGSSIAPSEKIANSGYTKNKAIIIGLFVRLTKLFEGSLMHITAQQMELSAIFSRLMIETVIKMFYLMSSKSPSYKSFVLTSYKSEREILSDLNKKEKQRQLIQIEQRIKRKILSRLKSDRISLSDLNNNKNWNIDGKDFRSLLKDIGYEDTYAYTFGSSSHFIHGDWYDISIQHLKKKGRHYQPKLEFQIPDPRITCTQTHLCLISLQSLIDWNKSDPDNYIGPIIEQAIKFNKAIDEEHERRLGA